MRKLIVGRVFLLSAKLLALVTSLVAAGLVGCGGGAASAPQPSEPGGGANPVPSIVSLAPPSVSSGSAGFVLTVQGQNFVSGSVVRWNNSDRPTTFVSSTQLTASISAGDVGAPSTADVSVFNPAPGGGTSNTLTVTITNTNSVPTLTSLSPPSTIAGGPSLILTVNGSNFISSSVVRWKGADRPTTFVSSTELTASIPASDIGICQAGTNEITVFNPAPGGGTSNSAAFIANNPNPSLTALSDSRVLVGSRDFTLRISGTGFVCTSVVRWNGSDRLTTFVDETLLLAAISAGDMVDAGTAQVTVSSPAPGGGASSALPLTIAPNLISISPSSATAGGPALTLTVNGFGFIPGSIVRWITSATVSNPDRPTTFVSSTVLTAAIDRSDISQAGSATVVVFNPAPSGGGSNFQVFAINPAAPGVLQRVSVASDGAEALLGADAPPRLSADGRFIAFSSADSALVPSDNNGATDIFVRDTCRGVSTNCTPKTVRVSVASDGTEPFGGGSSTPAISADGRFVAFESAATNLVPDDTNSLPDIFVQDRDADADGIFDEAGAIATVRVSVAGDGAQANQASSEPSISADGRRIAFLSPATNLVPGNANTLPDIFVHDRDADADGIFDEPGGIAMVRVVDDGDASISEPVLSANGRFVAYSQDFCTGDLFCTTAVGVRDTCFGAGAGCLPSDAAAFIAMTFDVPQTHAPALSANGRFVAFQTTTDFLPQDTNNRADIFVHDRSTGVTIRVSEAVDGTQADGGGAPALSPDGRFVAFASGATNLVPGDTNGVADIFVLDRGCGFDMPGCSPNKVLARVSLAGDGSQANGHSLAPSLSADGSFVAFASVATNLVVGDTNAFQDVFLASTGFFASGGCACDAGVVAKSGRPADLVACNAFNQAQVPFVAQAVEARAQSGMEVEFRRGTQKETRRREITMTKRHGRKRS